MVRVIMTSKYEYEDENITGDVIRDREGAEHHEMRKGIDWGDCTPRPILIISSSFQSLATRIAE